MKRILKKAVKVVLSDKSVLAYRLKKIKEESKLRDDSEKYINCIEQILAKNGFSRENAILFTGFPKSGNTWARFVLYNYFSILYQGIEKGIDYKELNALQNLILERACDQMDESIPENYPAFFRTHLSYHKAFDHFTRTIYIYRNPLDTLISYYHFYKNRTVPFGAYPENERVKMYNLDYFVKSELPNWLVHYIDTVDKCTVVLCYEEMKVDTEGVFIKLFEALNLPLNIDVLRKSIIMSSFEEVKKMGEATNQRGGMGNEKFKGEFTRSGATKQYLDELKPSTIQFAKSILKKYNVPIEL